MPEGFSSVRERVELGTPAAGLDELAALLLGWQMHRRAGFTLQVGSAAAQGVDVLMTPPALFWIRARCRVVYVLDEPDRKGFAYGTLPGHPESGEELFLLTRSPQGRIAFEISAFSHPATRSAKLSGPIGPALQRLMTRRYLRAMASLAADLR